MFFELNPLYIDYYIYMFNIAYIYDTKIRNVSNKCLKFTKNKIL